MSEYKFALASRPSLSGRQRNSRISNRLPPVVLVACHRGGGGRYVTGKRPYSPRRWRGNSYSPTNRCQRPKCQHNPPVLHSKVPDRTPTAFPVAYAESAHAPGSWGRATWTVSRRTSQCGGRGGRWWRKSFGPPATTRALCGALRGQSGGNHADHGARTACRNRPNRPG